ncbi:MAG: DUF1552 domain-containing protein [Phycisphaeraceae bacterium]
MARSISRRTMLRGLGVTMALPLLEAMAPSSAVAQSVAARTAPRMGAFYFGTGMNIPDFLPKDTGRNFTFSPILKPVEKFREDMTVFSGSYLEHGGGHGGDYTFLTGQVGRRNDGTVVNGISADQLAARHFASETRFPSMQLSIARGTGYGGNLWTLSWNDKAVPLAAESDPYEIFTQLFRADNPRQRLQRQRDFRRRGSILDRVGEQAKELEAQVSTADRQKLDEYLTSVRQLEEQLQRNIDWAKKNKPQPDTRGMSSFNGPYAPHSTGWRYDTYAKMMYDLIALAYQTDSTRVVTYVVRRESAGGVYDEFGVSKDYHALTHHNNNTKDLAELTKVDAIYMSHWAYFLGRLKGMKQPDGSSLLDHTALAFSSGMGINHSRDQLPTALCGGKALGISHQGHMKLGSNTPLSSLWHTMLDRMGVPVPQHFQDSKGPIKELMA